MTARLASLEADILHERLSKTGLDLHLPPFNVRISSPMPLVATAIAQLYCDYELLPPDGFIDFHLRIRPGRRWPKPLCQLEVDGFQPFTPLGRDEAFALFEWGLNWCITSTCHTLLTIHSAVLERDNRVLILPAPSGSGKSTLCAALLGAGWRLFSDELTLLDPDTGLIHPSPRPVSLKNQSIDIIRRRRPDLPFGPLAHNALKGIVSHVRPPTDSVHRAAQTALPGWVVFPKFTAGAKADLQPLPKGRCFMQLAENSFNHHVLGRKGFTALADLVERSDCHEFRFSDLDEALHVLAQLKVPA